MSGVTESVMLLQGFARRALYGYAPPYACRMAVTSLADALAVTASGTVDVVDGVLQLNEEPPPELMPRVDVRKWLGPPGSRPPRRPRSSLAPPADGDYSDDDDLGVIFAREARPPPGDSGRDLLREKIDGLVGAEPEAVAAAPEVPAAPEEEPEDEEPELARGLRSLAGGAGVFADSRSGFAYPADYAVGPPVDGSTHNLGDLEAAADARRDKLRRDVMLAVILGHGAPQNVGKLRSSLAESGWDADKAEVGAAVDDLCATDKLMANRRTSDNAAFEVWAAS